MNWKKLSRSSMPLFHQVCFFRFVENGLPILFTGYFHPFVVQQSDIRISKLSMIMGKIPDWVTYGIKEGADEFDIDWIPVAECENIFFKDCKNYITSE